MKKIELKKLLIEKDLCIDNEYLDKYIDVIVNNENTLKQRGFDRHHIIPRYYYKHNNIKLDNTDSNLVYLSRVDHILAHIYLMKCSKEEYYVYANSYAVNKFVHILGQKDIHYDIENFVLNHKDYIDESARIFSELQSKRYKGKSMNISNEERKRRSELGKSLKNNLNKTGIMYNGTYMFISNDKVNEYVKLGATLGRGPHSEESKEKNRQSHIGKSPIITDEWRKAISRGKKGKPLSEETKQKISEALIGDTEKCGHIRGKICINDGNIIKYVDEQDFIDNYQPNGWVVGNIFRNSASNKNKIRINNETGAKYVTLEEFETKYKYEGWHRGYDWKKT